MPTPLGTVNLTLGLDLLDAANRYAKRKKLRLTTLVRTALAREIGRPDLADSVKRGRPPKIKSRS